jgi:murein DD-endopeptidase MepM/ murein hydrolase activator NlpD
MSYSIEDELDELFKFFGLQKDEPKVNKSINIQKNPSSSVRNISPPNKSTNDSIIEVDGKNRLAIKHNGITYYNNPSVPAGIGNIAMQILIDANRKNTPLGSTVPFEYNSIKYLGRVEMHPGYGDKAGPGHPRDDHRGISVYTEINSPIKSSPIKSDTKPITNYSKTTNQPKFNTIERKPSKEGYYNLPTSGLLVSRHSPGNATPTHPKGHFGIDLAGEVGTPVYAIGPGKVASISDEKSNPKGGIAVLTKHENGKISAYYAHLDKANVNVGDFVNQGTIIGYMGASGMIYNGKRRAGGSHLHLDVKVNGQSIDPLKLETMPIGQESSANYINDLIKLAFEFEKLTTG